MDVEELTRRRQAIIDRHGPWTYYNVELASGVYTMDAAAPLQARRVQRVLQVAADTNCKPLDALRVLDLGSHEGKFAVEFARHGADVVAVEVRAAHVEKAQLVRDWFELDNLELVQDDVRSVSAERHGSFDVVLCLGLLYHLGAADGVDLMSRVSQLCRRVAIVDTQIGLSGRVRHRSGAAEYRGALYREHLEDTTSAEREQITGASIDNPLSFWFTRPSLCNLLADVGFSSVYEGLNPPATLGKRDRRTLVAIKGRPIDVLGLPPGDSRPERWPERRRARAHPDQRRVRQFLLRHPGLDRRARREWRRLRGR